MTKQVKWSVGLSIGFSLLFCLSFMFFFTRAQNAARKPAPLTGTDKQLPPVSLEDAKGAKLDDQALRKGKIVLVFVSADCGACDTEAEFLNTVANRREDVTFYGILSYGQKTALGSVEEKLPFNVLFDAGSSLALKLGITRVPVKVFIEDGVIRKSWGGATGHEEDKIAFAQWLDSLS